VDGPTIAQGMTMGVVVVELKAVSALTDIHPRQVLTYLKLTGLPVGLLINFNVPKLTDGVRRVVNPGRPE
jgi:GxxExxY protein